MLEPYVAGFASIPKRLLSDVQVDRLKRMATVKPRAFRKQDDPPPPVFGWRESQTYLHLPISWGVAAFREMGFDDVFTDRTTLGTHATFPSCPDPYHENASDGQPQFCADIIEALKTRHACIGVAGTGNGKTASALYAIAKLERNALIVVPGEMLATNWKDEIVLHLGLEEEDIGWVQQGKCDYIGKRITIAVVNSLCAREYPKEFYSSFGVVVYDEVHSMAAATFSQTLGKIPARYKLALSANPKRKDGCENLFLNYFGADLVIAKDDPPMPCTALVVEYKLPFDPKKFPSDPSRALNVIIKLNSRNELLLKWIKKLYDKNRTIVVMSDRIEQLCVLRDMCRERFSIPLPELAIYAKQEIRNGTRRGVTVKELQRRKKNLTIRIYFATYGIFKQGENIPRLNAGVEATPRGDGIQPPGRIRRRRPGKSHPYWISISDRGSWLLETRTRSRIKEFHKAQITVTYAQRNS